MFYGVHLFWAGVSGIFLIFIAITVFTVFDEGPYQPQTARNYLLMATPLILSGISYLGVTGWMLLRGLPGIYIPVGALFLLGFGLVFATNTSETINLLT